MKGKFYDIDQNTDEWFELRAGLVTGSTISNVMANNGKVFGDPAKKLATKLALEQITGEPIINNYSNSHMQRGHEQEPIARQLYEYQTFNTVNNGGFFKGENVGVSPDGLVDDDGGIEIKSVIHTEHFDTIKRQTFPPKYKWQLLFEVSVTGRDWFDFVSYCSEFPEDKQLYIYRFNFADFQKEYEDMVKRLGLFYKLISERKEIILNSRYI